MDNLNVGDRLKNIRKKDKKSQEDFAKSVGISRSYLSDLENNRKSPSIKTIKEIANKLGVSTYYLLYGKKTISDFKKLGRSIEDYHHIAESENKEYLINVIDEFNIEKILKLSKEQDRFLASAFKKILDYKDFDLLYLVTNVMSSAFFVKDIAESDEYDNEDFDHHFNNLYQKSIEELTDYLRNLNNE